VAKPLEADCVQPDALQSAGHGSLQGLARRVALQAVPDRGQDDLARQGLVVDDGDEGLLGPQSAEELAVLVSRQQELAAIHDHLEPVHDPAPADVVAVGIHDHLGSLDRVRRVGLDQDPHAASGRRREQTRPRPERPGRRVDQHDLLRRPDHGVQSLGQLLGGVEGEDAGRLHDGPEMLHPLEHRLLAPGEALAQLGQEPLRWHRREQALATLLSQHRALAAERVERLVDVRGRPADLPADPVPGRTAEPQKSHVDIRLESGQAQRLERVAQPLWNPTCHRSIT
jgi:hypothetical protein